MRQTKFQTLITKKRSGDEQQQTQLPSATPKSRAATRTNDRSRSHSPGRRSNGGGMWKLAGGVTPSSGANRGKQQDLFGEHRRERIRQASMQLKKTGPRDYRRTGGRTMELASERAGIRPATAADFANGIQDYGYKNGFTTESSLNGFTSTTVKNQSGLPISDKKAGPIEIGRFRGACLASIQAGIAPHSNAEASWDPKFFSRFPGSMPDAHIAPQASLKGHSIEAVRNQSGLPIDTKKKGPIETGRNRGNCLASLAAGIPQWRNSEQRWDPQFDKRNPSAPDGAHGPSKATLQGFTATMAPTQSGLPLQKKKMGPIETGRFRGAALASIAAGIPPFKYSEAQWDPNFEKRLPGSAPDAHGVPNSALKGFTSSTAPNQSGLPIDTKKQGPIEIGRNKGLASNAAGIRSFHYSEAQWDPNFFSREPGAQAGSKKISDAHTSFTSSALPIEKQSKMPIDSIPKKGPIQIGRSKQKLASQLAGIEPLTASNFVPDPNFFSRTPGAGENSHSLPNAALKGFTVMPVGNQSGLPIGNGRKPGPVEIGRSAGALASVAAGIRRATPADHGDPNFSDYPPGTLDNSKILTAGLKGFTITDTKSRPFYKSVRMLK